MDLDRVLNAKSVAIVGASRDEGKRGFQAIKALLASRYEGAVYPVNPREERILGLRCYRSVLDIEGPLDLVLVVTPAETIPEILDECGRKQVAGVVIVSGGFGELGGIGRRLQSRLVAIANKYGTRIVGPNTSGLINVHDGLNLVGLADVPKGDLALLSQSGNMALHLITEAGVKSQKGFSYYIGVGNEADIKFHEYLEFLTRDSRTRTIVMYVEGMSEGRLFLQQAHRTTREKPVVLLKGGRSHSGGRAAVSHTGALAGISEVARTALGRAGIVTVENSDELFPAAEALSSLPPMSGDRVAILADGGGHAAVAADVLTEHGLKIPELRRETRERLADRLSPNASLRNPVDVAGTTDTNPGVFADCARIMLEDSRVDGLLLVGLFGGYGIRFASRLSFMEEDAAHRLGKLVRKTRKPILVHSLYKFSKPHSHDLLRYYGIPVHDSVEVTCKCIAVLAEYGHFVGTIRRRTSFVFKWGARAKPEGQRLIETVVSERRRNLLEHEAKKLMALHGAPVTEDRLATDAEEAADIAERLESKVALKICSPDIPHKSDADGVRLGVRGRSAVAEAFTSIVESARRFRPAADIRGCLVTPMAAAGTEVIIGTKIDPQFGPVIMFGIGGILVEVVKDVVFRVLPISRFAARQMLSEIRGASILNGFRGEPPADREALVELLLDVGEVVEAYPAIQEMDLNPVIVNQNGACVVDARVRLKRNPAEPPRW